MNKKEINPRTLVFLPGPDSQLTFPNSEEVTQSALNEPVIIDTGQEYNWLVDTSYDTVAFFDDLLAPQVPAPSAHLGELNTPTIGKLIVVVDVHRKVIGLSAKSFDLKN